MAIFQHIYLKMDLQQINAMNINEALIWSLEDTNLEIG